MNLKDPNLEKQIEAFIKNQMSSNERIAFQKAIEEDELLAKKVKVFELEKLIILEAVNEDLLNTMQTWEPERKALVNKANFKVFIRRLSAIAAIGLLVFFGTKYLNITTTDSIQNKEYFAESFSFSKGIKSDDPKLGNIAQLMKEEAYPKAIQLLREIQDSTLFYHKTILLGEAFFKTGAFNQAIESFQSIIDQVENPSEEREMAEWRLLVSYYKNNDNQYKRILENILKDQNHIYYRQASEFPKELNQ